MSREYLQPFSNKKRIVVLFLVAFALAGLLVYFRLDPEKYALFPKCWFRSLTGWDCPGCGSQRTIHALLHGDISRAFSYNPLLVLSIPYLGVAVWLEFLNGKSRAPRLRRILMGRNACIVIFVVIMLYWAGRNIF